MRTWNGYHRHRKNHSRYELTSPRPCRPSYRRINQGGGRPGRKVHRCVLNAAPGTQPSGSVHRFEFHLQLFRLPPAGSGRQQPGAPSTGVLFTVCGKCSNYHRRRETVPRMAIKKPGNPGMITVHFRPISGRSGALFISMMEFPPGCRNPAETQPGGPAEALPS